MVLFNKVDKLEKEEQRVLDTQFKTISDHRLFISAKQGLNLEALKAKLLELAGLPDLARQDVIVTNLRHYQALKAAHEAILRVQEGLSLEQSSEFLSQDLRECIHHLGEITGVITTDEVLGNIFAHFCIGK
jgi:tRNA modification GTPase